MLAVFNFINTLIIWLFVEKFATCLMFIGVRHGYSWVVSRGSLGGYLEFRVVRVDTKVSIVGTQTTQY